MTWVRLPSSEGSQTYIPFAQGAHSDKKEEEQFPWSEVGFKQDPLTKAGCCMAFTVYFFDWYRTNGERNLKGYFKWVRTVKGISSIMNLQTKYLGWSTGFGKEPTQSGNALTRALNGFRRKVEDQTYRQMNFRSVSSPNLPSSMGSLTAEVMQPIRGQEGCIYKPIYLASLTDGCHAIGAIIDRTGDNYLFFDSNHGLAYFQDAERMTTWLRKVQEQQYKEDYTAFFCDAKVPV